MHATLKYFWIVVALIAVQVGLGAVTAHYGVEGDGFFGIPLAKWLPYSVARTWHTQLGIFWIATAWLATGLFVAPAVSGREPLGQRFGVNFLFVCLLVIVVGSLSGEWLGVQQKLGFVPISGLAIKATNTLTSAASGKSFCSSVCLCGCSSWFARCGRQSKIPDRTAICSRCS